MYYPYFRGKQYELITIRECAPLLSNMGFTPIIEPVRDSITGLTRTLKEVEEHSGKAILIVNPYHGQSNSEREQNLISLLQTEFSNSNSITPAVLLREDADLTLITQLCSNFEPKHLTLIHAGFPSAKGVTGAINNFELMQHVFMEDHCGKLYRKHFNGTSRILIRDGFQKRTGRDYPDLEFFSDLHATFSDEGVDGFGDFLIVGDDYSDGGGPAYTVVIHITCVDYKNDEEMIIYHFKSDRQDDPKDPGGKFAEALNKLINELGKAECQIITASAISEFIDLHSRQHFPGLGYVKKLSMKHHLEIMAEYFTKTNN